MSQQLDPCNAYHTDEQRWAAVLARDAAADGAFVYAVKTTGVYCRPSSSARRPRRENVEFFATAEAAEAAGYRPSRRAAGDRSLAAEQRAERVAQACRMIETAETPPALEALAARLGMSPFHFHRLFKAETGLTPKAYASAYRARRLRERLGQASASVTEAIYDSGFNSNSRFYESSSQRLGMRPRDYRDGGAGAAIRFAIGQCSLGAILVAQSQRGICAILLGEEPEPLLRELQDQFPRAPAATPTSNGWWRRWWASSSRLNWDWTCRWTYAVRRSRNGSGRHCGKYRRAARRAMRRSPNGSARRERCVRWPRPARRTGSRWRFPATGWYVATATFPATAGAWSASANCCAGKSGIEPKARRYAARNAKSPLDGGLYAMGRWSFSWFQYPCQG